MYEVSDFVTFAKLWLQERSLNNTMNESFRNDATDAVSSNSCDVTSRRRSTGCLFDKVKNNCLASQIVSFDSPVAWLTDDTVVVTMHDLESLLDACDEYNEKLLFLAKIVLNVKRFENDIKELRNRIVALRSQLDCGTRLDDA